MRRVTRLIAGILIVGYGPFVVPALGDLFGSGVNTFEIEFVPIGEPGNLADSTGDPNPAGSVPYTYRIGKYEVSEQMINKANAQSASEGVPLEISIDARGPNKPATSVSWFEAARFVNWLNTSAGHAPAYKFDTNGDFQLWERSDAGYDPANLFRNRRARYVLPSVDEWYKAAFYDPVTDSYFDFPTGNDNPPTPVAAGTAAGTAVFDQPFEQGPADIMLAGGPSPFGTVGQAGNVEEWDETDFFLSNDSSSYHRGIRGGSWMSYDVRMLESIFRTPNGPGIPSFRTGFRIAAIPEPRAIWLATFSASAVLLFCNRVHRSRVH